MDGFALAVSGLQFFGFDVNCLANLLEGARLQATVARDMGDDLQFLAVGIGLDSGVESRGCIVRLDMKSACDKECSQGQQPAQAGAPYREIRCGGYECYPCSNPPEGGTPLVETSNH